jgi:hypothetical protein
MSDEPESASEPAGGVELLRAWLVDGELHCRLQSRAFRDPGDWGAVLADVAGHIAEALREQDGLALDSTLQRIREVFEEELREPPGDVEG